MQAQAADPPARFSRRDALGWAGGWAAVLLLAVWMQRLSPGWLAGAAVAAAAWAALARSVPARWRLGGGLVLAVALAAAGVTQYRLWRVAHDWEDVRFKVEERAGTRLRAGLDQLFDRGGRAIAGAQALVDSGGRGVNGRLFARLDQARRRADVTALAVYDARGVPLVWAGEHRGTVPDSVRAGLVESSFSAGPLFGYVYFAQKLKAGRVAVAAVLLESHVRVGEGAAPYADQVVRRYGMTPRFTTPELAQGDVIWDWTTRSDTILSVVFGALTQDRWRARVAERGTGRVAIAWAAAVVVLALAWYRGGARPPGIPVAAVTAALLLLPLGPLLGAEELFSPTRFVVPAPGDLTLGQLLVVLAGLSVWLMARPRASRFLGRIPLAVRVVPAAAVLVLALAAVRLSVAGGVLAERPAGGAPLVVALALLVAAPLLALFGRGGRDERVRTGPVVAALLLAGALGLALAFWWAPGRDVSVWFAAAWAVPFALAAWGVPRSEVGRGALLPWAAVAWIAGTLAVSTLWTLHLNERLREAEREIGRLGTQADPFLDFLLRQFAEDVLRLDAEGRRGVSLLYQAWVEAGLAREGYEGRITLWRRGEPVTELRLAEASLPPERVQELLGQAAADEEPKVARYADVPGLHYLVAVPLVGGEAVTVAVPPRAYLGRSTSLARFLDPGQRTADAGAGAATLSLVPATPGERIPTGALRWLRAEGGWRSETVVAFPGAPLHAHLTVETPSRFLVFARGVLAAVMVLLVAAVLWAVGRTLCGEPLGMEPAQWGWLFTFRGRLTGALFVFFLLPMAAFGVTAYGALSREVVRTAGALAERALAQAASEAQGNSLGQLARHVGADLLLYDGGVLTQAAVPEVIDLGLYHTWLPPAVYLDFAVGEAVERLEDRRLSGQEYVVAYRRFGPRVLASPTPLAEGVIARRQRELADVVLLFGLIGAALSVILSLLVGRALSRPIESLSAATAAVGQGDLSVRLPAGRRDEFGKVYRSFNRMVRSLRLARAALVRETRRTEAIVEEAGTGVVAL
ncbi:MAG TPA: HAMP domain-containing protein, partial [Longimicrobium sp.]|nr:HAMP domain-containing protein [Longimicrobium sp.]